CTGAPHAIIHVQRYKSLLQGETDREVNVDWAIPNAVDAEGVAHSPIQSIEVSRLQAIAEKNKMDRYAELESADAIIQENIRQFLPVVKQRRVEVAMREVPQKIKEIRSLAVNEVFAQDLQNLDPQAREVLDKVISYMEKK